MATRAALVSGPTPLPQRVAKFRSAASTNMFIELFCVQRLKKRAFDKLVVSHLKNMHTQAMFYKVGSILSFEL